MAKNVTSAAKAAARSLLILPPLPASLAARHRAVSRERLDALEARLSTEYFPSERLSGEGDGQKILRDQLIGRLEIARRWFVPWLAGIRPLDGLRILEVGCGTGSSTVALSEQGARVTGIDIEEPSLRIARARLDAYELPGDVHQLNIADFARRFAGEPFDLIIFYASLEHMTHEERLSAMSETWRALRPGACWCVVDTPNRLWWMDSHTSFMPFFQWLPDDLALQYTRFSPRPLIRDLPRGRSEEEMVGFLRKGRGVSYHEFELAMGPLETLDVAGCMKLDHRRHRPVAWWRRRWTDAGRYERFLVRVAPHVPRAFLLSSLDLVLRKRD